MKSGADSGLNQNDTLIDGNLTLKGVQVLEKKNHYEVKERQLSLLKLNDGSEVIKSTATRDMNSDSAVSRLRCNLEDKDQKTQTADLGDSGKQNQEPAKHMFWWKISYRNNKMKEAASSVNENKFQLVKERVHQLEMIKVNITKELDVQKENSKWIGC